MRFLPLAALFFGAAASAQPATWLPIDDGNSISLTVHKPTFEDTFVSEDGFSTFSSAQFLQARIAATPTLSIVADLPTAYGSIEGFGGDELSAFVLGNPYVGIDVALPSTFGSASAELGVRLPVVETLIETESDDFAAFFVGQFASYDRLGAFLSETATLVARTAVAYDVTPQVSIVGDLTPQLLIPVGDDTFDDSDPELLLGYTIGGEAQAGPALIRAGFRGTGIITEEIGEGGDRFLHAAGVGVEVQAGAVRPGAFIEVPINGDNEEILGVIFGFGVTFGLD